MKLCFCATRAMLCSFVTWGSVEVFYFKGKKHFEDTFNLPNTVYHVTVILVFHNTNMTPPNHFDKL